MDHTLNKMLVGIGKRVCFPFDWAISNSSRFTLLYHRTFMRVYWECCKHFKHPKITLVVLPVWASCHLHQVNLYRKMLTRCGEPANRISLQVVSGGDFIKILQFLYGASYQRLIKTATHSSVWVITWLSAALWHSYKCRSKKSEIWQTLLV